LRLCAEHPDRVLGSVFIAPTARLMPPLAARRVERFDEVIDAPVGWQTYNAHYWKTQLPRVRRGSRAAHFYRAALDEQVEGRGPDGRWETDGETLTAADRGIERCDAAATRRLPPAPGLPGPGDPRHRRRGARLRRGRGAGPVHGRPRS